MPESEMQRLWEKLDVLGRQYERLATTMSNNHDMLLEVRTDVKNMSMHGCSKATQHDDHEKRLRDVESSRNMLAGAASLAGAAFGIFGSWLLKKIGEP